jgi:hypothetical protein
MSLLNRPPLTEKQIARNQANSNGVTTLLAEASTRPLLAPCLPSGIARATKLARQFLHTTKIAKRTWISINHIESKRCTEIGAVANWRIFRAWTIEAASPTHEQNRVAEAKGNSGAPTDHGPSTQTMLAFRSLSHQPNLDNLSRREGRFDPQYHHAAGRLLRLQVKMRQRSLKYADKKELSK